MSEHTRGDISLYIVVMVGMMILGSAVLIGLILAQQISLTEDLVASERAFYAASAGTEEGFYELALHGPGDVDQPDLDSFVDYPITGGPDRATYQGNISRRSGGVCGSATGVFAGERRRIQIGPNGC